MRKSNPVDKTNNTKIFQKHNPYIINPHILVATVVTIVIVALNLYMPTSPLINTTLVAGGCSGTGSALTGKLTITTSCSFASSNNTIAYTPGTPGTPGGGGGGVGIWSISTSTNSCIQDYGNQSNFWANNPVQSCVDPPNPYGAGTTGCIYWDAPPAATGDVTLAMMCPPDTQPTTSTATGTSLSCVELNSTSYAIATMAASSGDLFTSSLSSYNTLSSTYSNDYYLPLENLITFGTNMNAFGTAFNNSAIQQEGQLLEAFGLDIVGSSLSGSSAIQNTQGVTWVSLLNSYCIYSYPTGTPGTPPTEQVMTTSQATSCFKEDAVSIVPQGSRVYVAPWSIPPQFLAVNSNWYTIANFPSEVGVTDTLYYEQQPTSTNNLTQPTLVETVKAVPQNYTTLSPNGYDPSAYTYVAMQTSQPLKSTSLTCSTNGGNVSVTVTPIVEPYNTEVDPNILGGDVTGNGGTPTQTPYPSYFQPGFNLSSSTGCSPWWNTSASTQSTITIPRGNLQYQYIEPHSGRPNNQIGVATISSGLNPICVVNYGVDSYLHSIAGPNNTVIPNNNNYGVGASVDYYIDYNLSYTLNGNTVTQSIPYYESSPYYVVTAPSGATQPVANSNGGVMYWTVLNSSTVNVNPHDVNCNGSPCVTNPAG